MSSRSLRGRPHSVAVLLCGLAWSCASCLAGADEPSSTTSEPPPRERFSPQQLRFFEAKIRPLLVGRCYGCHSDQAGQAKGGLKLDTRQALRAGGNSGPAVVAGDPDSSLLFNAITHAGFEMPPGEKLGDAEIADVEQWILSGAPDPRTRPDQEAPASTIEDHTIAQARATFWAYQRPTRRVASADAVQVDNAEASTWATTEIDRYLWASLRGAGLQPAPDAPANVVLRRLCFDLVGLPPNPEQVRLFEQAYRRDAEAAVARTIDRLLELPQFGEHWGRHWLDVARYAESTGREVNMTYPQAWRYRDYVIDAFNADKPYDEFVQEQIAGDLLPAASDREWTEQLIATGFLALGTKNVNEQSAAQFAADLADEQIDVTTRVLLGTSVACARCHDHKFDPIRQRDYYALAGIFRSTQTFFGNPPSRFGRSGAPQQRRYSSLLLLPVPDETPIGPHYRREELAEMRDEVETIQQQLRQLRSGRTVDGAPGATPQQQRIRLNNQLSQLSAKLAVVDPTGRPRSYCMGVQDKSTLADAPLLVRGEIDQPADPVPRGLPVVFGDQPLEIIDGSSGRLELARWIGSDRNPLAARVMVNRIWHHVFGQGLVPTTEDFGMTGTPPSHPALLDHLAIEFVNAGWSVKEMIRQMANTRAYRMQSRFDVASHRRDPDNRLLWRSNVKRLEAESIRDAMLTVAGELETERPVGSVVAEAGYMRVRNGQLSDLRELIRSTVRQTLAERRAARPSPREVLRRRARPGAAGSLSPMRASFGEQRLGEIIAEALEEASLDCNDQNCRSVYLPVVRDFVPRSLEVFDFPDPSLVTGARETSNTANQALFMLNNPLTLRLSDAFAQRIARAGADRAERVELAFLMAYGRPASSEERVASHRYLRDCGLPPQSALAAFCQSLFAAAEFRYLN